MLDVCLEQSSWRYRLATLRRRHGIGFGRFATKTICWQPIVRAVPAVMAEMCEKQGI